jgi:REP element-mobilizing transposase RayT
MGREHIYKEHNVSLLMYHFVCPAKYRRDIFTKEVEETLIDICKEIEKRFEIQFDEIGADNDHVHFLIQSVPMLSPKQVIQTVKSITAKELFKKHPEVKKKLR